MAVRIPYSIFPSPLLIPFSRNFLAIGTILSKPFPSLKVQLMQSGMEFTPREWASIAFVSAALNSFTIFLMIEIIGIAAKINLFAFAIGAGALMGAISVLTILSYPKVMSTKRVRELENNLISALRQMLIELKSGVSLFEAMKSVSKGYGEVSKEFRFITDQIENGISEVNALNDASTRNPSFKFRRALWQITNAISVGSDINVGLSDLVSDLTKEKMDEIKRYGQELNPWTMMYMMAAVIMPSLGVSILNIMLSFLNIKIPDYLYPAIIIYLILFQIFFISFVRSRRPVID